jgi:2-methylisocitrate lyase-like PEP mutase family enzyme
VYAPGLRDLGQISTLVEAVSIPANVLALRGVPTVSELASAGVRRVSTGGGLAAAAYAALISGARELQDEGATSYAGGAALDDVFRAAFGGQASA